ncbi:RBBP9/YdeN family alpha/beta hydrolase [Sphingomonas sp. CJ99]
MTIFDGRDRTSPTILTVPGLDNSGPGHWQTIWEQLRGDTRRVELGLWNAPQRNPWVTRLDRAITESPAPVVLVGHSLGCIAIAWWATMAAPDIVGRVAGALMVAPADVDWSDRQMLRTFRPIPVEPLPFPSILVASSDDPWLDFDRAHHLATHWGSLFHDAGALGHINADSGIGSWPEGQELLARLTDGSIHRTATRRVPPRWRSLRGDGSGFGLGSG